MRLQPIHQRHDQPLAKLVLCRWPGLLRETTKPAAEYHHAKLEKHSSWSNLRRNFDFTPVRPRPDPAVNPARLSAGCRTAAALGRDNGTSAA